MAILAYITIGIHQLHAHMHNLTPTGSKSWPNQLWRMGG
jgi:hypothetical protein